MFQVLAIIIKLFACKSLCFYFSCSSGKCVSVGFLHCVLCVCMSCIILCSFVLIKPYGWIFFIYWLHWDFVAMCGLSLVMVSGGYSLTAVCRLHIVVASLVEHSL